MKLTYGATQTEREVRPSESLRVGGRARPRTWESWFPAGIQSTSSLPILAFGVPVFLLR